MENLQNRSTRHLVVLLAALASYAAPAALFAASRPTAAPRLPYIARLIRGDTASDAQISRYAARYRISRELARKIVDAARAEGVDPELGFRLVRVESVFKTNARGPGGSLGLVQLMPGTARSVDRSLRTTADIINPDNNLRVGFRYLRQMIRRYDGDVRLGLLAYNRGENAVDRALRRGRDPENGYSRRILGARVHGEDYRGPGLARKR